MLRKLCLIAALLACAPALAQSYGGTYTTENPQGGTLTLTLRQDARRTVSGTLAANDATFAVQAEATDEGLVGTVTGAGETLPFLAQREGGRLNVLLGTHALVMTRVPGTPQGKSAARKTPAPAAGGDGQLAQLLTGSAWCGFTYNQHTGTSRRERVVFGADGRLTQTTGADTYTSGRHGSVAGQHGGGRQGRWKVQGHVLHLSEDGFNWAPQALQVTRNSNGYPIIKSGGKEYMQCH